MTNAIISCLLGLACSGATLAAFKIIHPDSPPGVYDNGLADWRQDTNHAYGVFISDCTRIVKLPSGKYQPQFRNVRDTNAVWAPLFQGETAYADLVWAQYHIRQAFELKKEVTGALQDAFRVPLTATSSPTPTPPHPASPSQTP